MESRTVLLIWLFVLVAAVLGLTALEAEAYPDATMLLRRSGDLRFSCSQPTDQSQRKYSGVADRGIHLGRPARRRARCRLPALRRVRGLCGVAGWRYSCDAGRRGVAMT